MPTVYVSMTGIGYMGRNHLAKVLKLQDAGKAELVAVCDPKFGNPSYERTTPRDVRHYADFRDMVKLDVPKPHLVVIASPTQYHAEQSMRALLSPKVSGVLCEKPMSANAGEAGDVKRAQQFTGKPTMTAFVEYFNPAFRYAQNPIQHEIGDIDEIEIVRSRPPLEAGRRPGAGHLSDVGFDCGVHDIANLLMLYAVPGINKISINGRSQETKVKKQNPSRDLFEGDFQVEINNALLNVLFRLKMTDSFAADERYRRSTFRGNAGTVNIDYIKQWASINVAAEKTEWLQGDSLEIMYDAVMKQMLEETEYPVPLNVSIGSVQIMKGIRPATNKKERDVNLTMELFI
ncbi:MAG: Gfo/Idh/MocA family oxidoreductase [Candidatus Aenigmarchaeota archaeon]|nr:Gfo/Idh/MocA family oxidoreductase [Candidatus Aenigmarchaeota archaeon]